MSIPILVVLLILHLVLAGFQVAFGATRADCGQQDASGQYVWDCGTSVWRDVNNLENTTFNPQNDNKNIFQQLGTLGTSAWGAGNGVMSVLMGLFGFQYEWFHTGGQTMSWLLGGFGTVTAVIQGVTIVRFILQILGRGGS